ncbi:hypothetical protein I4U23_011591 [Adineta vaga]|nr:hypothetical protein I4U23_011591 [Adineta vaga]
MSSSGGSKSIPFASHSGTRVTLADGSQYLIHKGPGPTFTTPAGNPTIITPASNMKKSNWQNAGPSYQPGTTVGRMMNNGQYSALRNNCNDATANMPHAPVQTTKVFGVSTGIKSKK